MCGSISSQAKVLGRRMNKSQGKNPRVKTGISTTVVQCKNCELIYANPQPIPVNINQHYGVPPESYWSAHYFEINPDYFKHQIDTFFQLYQHKSNLKALDIGAGIGKCMIALERAGFDAEGFEPSTPFYKKAIEKMNIDERKLKLFTIEEAIFPLETFDFITFGAVLEHLYDPSAAIQKALTWLKPSGLIHIEVPSSKWLINRIANFYYKIQGLDYVANISPMHTPFHLYEFGLKSFELNARIHNYQIVHHKYEVCSTYLPKIFDVVAKPFMEATKTGMQLEIWLKKN